MGLAHCVMELLETTPGADIDAVGEPTGGVDLNSWWILDYSASQPSRA